MIRSRLAAIAYAHSNSSSDTLGGMKAVHDALRLEVDCGHRFEAPVKDSTNDATSVAEHRVHDGLDARAFKECNVEISQIAEK